MRSAKNRHGAKKQSQTAEGTRQRHRPAVRRVCSAARSGSCRRRAAESVTRACVGHGTLKLSKLHRRLRHCCRWCYWWWIVHRNSVCRFCDIGMSQNVGAAAMYAFRWYHRQMSVVRVVQRAAVCRRLRAASGEKRGTA